MARTKGPLFSLEASGTLAKTIVYSKWKGRQYTRKHTIPENPQSAKQVNVRTAFTLLITEWQGEDGAAQTIWDTYAKQFDLSGFNSYVSRGQKEYVIQITTAVTPSSVSVTGDPPAEVWTWAAAV